MRFLAFVSYAHRDARQARWLHHAIETYRLPARLARELGSDRRPGRLFLDRSELSSSADLSAAIAAALAESENLLLVCSPAAARSRWVNEEVRRFREMRGRDRIFCLIVDGDPALRDGPGGCFPPALLAPEPGDDRPVEPLAADIRPGQDGRTDARLKLLAGLIGVEFDRLRQREQARRLRRLTALALVLGVIAAALLAMAVAAVLARNEARRQAETATRTTDFLRALFTGADPADARGRDWSVRAMVDRGAERIATAPELRAQPRVRADLMTTLAEIYVTLGEYRTADALAKAAGATDRSSPPVALRQDQVRAEIASAEGRFPAARTLIDRALAAAGPEPSAARASLLVDRAFVEHGLGEDDAADRSLLLARQVSLSLHPPDRETADRALKELATRRAQRGRYAEARRGFALLLRARGDTPDDPLVGTAYNELGAISYKLGDDEDARRWFARALAIETRLLGAAHPKVAAIKGNLARTMVEQRRFAPALRLLSEARAAVVAQQGAGAALLAWQDDSIGLALMGSGDPTGAEAAFRRGLAIARTTGASKEADLAVDLADLLCATGRAAAAPALLDAAGRAYRAAATTPPWALARADLVRGACLIRAGDPRRGRALVDAGAPAVIARWGRNSLFGAEAEALRSRRLRVDRR